MSRTFTDLARKFVKTLELVFFITIPAAVGLSALREPIVALLLKRGEFDVQATLLTAQALLYYSEGRWAFSAVRTVAVAFLPCRIPEPHQLGDVSGSIVVGFCVYGAGSYMIKSPELRRMFVEAGIGIEKK